MMLNVFENLPPETLGFALLSLYDFVDGYEEFCDWLRLDPTEPASVDLFNNVHANYVRAWAELGHNEFERQLRLHRRYLL